MKTLSRIDHHYLTTVMSIQSHSNGGDATIRSFILDELKKMNVKVQEDTYGNIYVTKGKVKEYPCVVAHVDTVQPILKEIIIQRQGDTLYAFDPIKRRQAGIGGDDKVGVYMLLQALNDVDNLKAVFFRDEEIGCVGSRHSITHQKSWYDDCMWVVQADRRGNSDFITTIYGTTVCSDEFYEDCSNYMTKYGYKKSTGISTDVHTLAVNGIGISCINISCGYHEPHSDIEVISFSDVNTAYNLMYDIITRVSKKKYLHTPKDLYASSRFKKKEYGHSNLKPGPQQKQLFSTEQLDISNYATLSKFKEFVHTNTTSSGVKIYDYRGIDNIPLIGDPGCPECGERDSLHFLPYEGRIYCIEHNNYVDDEVSQKLVRYVEKDDENVTFVFSVYSSGWLDKSESVWSIKLDAWVPETLPFK